MVPHTLKFVNVWRQTVRFTFRVPYPRERGRDMHQIGGWIHSGDATAPKTEVRIPETITCALCILYVYAVYVCMYVAQHSVQCDRPS